MPRRSPLPLTNVHTTEHAIFAHQDSAPPSYEEAINPNAPPPTYDSLFGRVREAQKSSKGILEFLKNLLIIILGTFGCTIILGVTIVIPMCMIVIGILYMHDCPQGEYIPVYLVVGGLFGILKQLLHLSARVRQTEEERREETSRQSPTQTLLNCFMLGWFIIGSVWVYKEYEPNYDQRNGIYCNKIVYLFAFWLITSVYVLLVILTVCLCLISIDSNKPWKIYSVGKRNREWIGQVCSNLTKSNRLFQFMNNIFSILFISFTCEMNIFNLSFKILSIQELMQTVDKYLIA